MLYPPSTHLNPSKEYTGARARARAHVRHTFLYVYMRILCICISIHCVYSLLGLKWVDGGYNLTSFRGGLKCVLGINSNPKPILICGGFKWVSGINYEVTICPHESQIHLNLGLIDRGSRWD